MNWNAAPDGIWRMSLYGWIDTACIFAVFNISKAKGAGGNNITPYEEYDIRFAWYFIGCLSGISKLTIFFLLSETVPPCSSEHEDLVRPVAEF